MSWADRFGDYILGALLVIILACAAYIIPHCVRRLDERAEQHARYQACCEAAAKCQAHAKDSH